jgi:ATP-binding cassette subfamily C (CFTR/MRP) protein 4
MHNTIIHKLARTSTRFYDENSSGKIMGRCSKDIALMDDFLSWMFSDMIQVVLIAVSSLVTMTIGNFWLTAAIVPAIVALVFITRIGGRPAKKAHRADLHSKSPIFGHLSLITTGLYSIRAFGMIDGFKKRFYELAEKATRYHYTVRAINQWMHYRNDLVGGFFIVTNIVVAVAARDTLDPAMLAVGLSLTIQVILSLVWAMQQITRVQSLMTSPQRMF